VKLLLFCVFVGAADHRTVINVSLCQLYGLIREFRFCFYTLSHLPRKQTQHLKKMLLSELNTNEYGDFCHFIYIKVQIYLSSSAGPDFKNCMSL
jgi:hypothetical protein